MDESLQYQNVVDRLFGMANVWLTWDNYKLFTSTEAYHSNSTNYTCKKLFNILDGLESCVYVRAAQVLGLDSNLF